MNVFLINDTSDDPNWGARATSHAMRQMIEENGDVIGDTLFSVNLTISRNRNFNNEESAQVEKMSELLLPPIFPKAVRRISKLMKKPELDIVPAKWEDFDTFAIRFLDKEIFEDVYNAFETNDAVILNGEGCVYGIKRESRLIYFLAYVSKQYFHKPTAIVNHTADLSHPVLRQIAENVYPLMDDVVFRETVSARLCREFCRGVVAADASFIYRPMHYQEWVKTASRSGYFDVFPNRTYDFDPSKPYICLGGSSVYLREEIPDYDPAPGYEKLVLELKKEFGQVVLTASAGSDQEVMQPISEKWGIPLIGLQTSFRQAIDIIGNAKVYIGGRWHPSIFALSGGTPVVPLSAFTFKMKALMQEMELDVPVINSLNLINETDKIMQITHEHLKHGESLRYQIKDKSDKNALSARRNVGILKSMDEYIRK